jgi:RNA polymerase sigma factor (sigma-70 family)
MAFLASPPLLRWPAFLPPVVVGPRPLLSGREGVSPVIHNDNAPLLGRFEYGIVRKKVRQIIGRAGFKSQDREDLEQELLTRLLHSLKSFDPAKAHRKCFVTAVVERDVANIMRDKKAKKRDHRRISSLHVMIEVADEGSTELSATIGDGEFNARLCRHRRSAEELSQLASDLADVVATLPDDLRALAERLKTQSIAEIARSMGIPRTTLNHSVRQILARFAGTGLREYL